VKDSQKSEKATTKLIKNRMFYNILSFWLASIRIYVTADPDPNLGFVYLVSWSRAEGGMMILPPASTSDRSLPGSMDTE
jgi:hypothetical protein